MLLKYFLPCLIDLEIQKNLKIDITLLSWRYTNYLNYLTIKFVIYRLLKRHFKYISTIMYEAD